MAAHPRLVRVAVNAAASGDIIAAAAGKRYKILHLMGLSGGTGTVKFRTGTTDVTGAMDVVAGGGFDIKDYEYGLFENANANESFNVVLTSSATFKGFCIYQIFE